MSVRSEPSWTPEDNDRAELLGILRQVVEDDDIARKMDAVAYRERNDPEADSWMDDQLRKVADETIWDQVEVEPDPKDFWNWRAQRQ
jgi:hypothetical protein